MQLPMFMQIYIKVFVIFPIIQQHLYMVSTLRFSVRFSLKKGFKRSLNIPVEDRLRFAEGSIYKGKMLLQGQPEEESPRLLLFLSAS